MITIKNAMMLGGRLATLEIANGQFTAVKVQDRRAVTVPDAMTLGAFSRLNPCSGATYHEVDAAGELIVPAGIDVHVHSRDPGFTEKEDWKSLARSAFKGGVVGVVDMPNTSPPTMDRAAVVQKAEIASESGLLFKILLGVGPKNLEALPELLNDSSLPLAGIKVYYGQSTGDLMFNRLDLLSKAIPRSYRGRLVFHSEDQCRIDQRADTMKKQLDERQAQLENYSIHSEIRDSKAAWISTQQILDWAIKDQRNIHLAHVSTSDEIEMLEAAKRDGLQATCELSPHHALISTEDYGRLGSFAKVNPPVRTLREVKRLREKLALGLIDCFATDHAPHTKDEKKADYFNCPSGIPSIEFYWPLLFKLADECGIPISRLAPMAGSQAAELFGFKKAGQIKAGFDAHFVWMGTKPYILQEHDVEAKCQWSPYVGSKMQARVIATWKQGNCVYQASSTLTS